MSGKVGKGEVSLLDQLKQLVEDEIVLGYREGWDDPKPPTDKSRSYVHGWLNAQVDRGRMQPSEAMRRLAHEYVRAQR